MKDFLIFPALTAADPIVVTGAPGNFVSAGRNEVNRLLGRAQDEGRPVRLEGRFVSAGTYLLHAVEHVPHSCIAPDAIVAVHRALSPMSLAAVPIPLQGEAGRVANEAQAEAYSPAMRQWFLAGIEAGTITAWFTNLRGSDMARFGYRVCDEGVA
jgi:hypothetical protein